MRLSWFIERFVLRRLLREWPRVVLLIPAIALGVAIAITILSTAEQSISSFEEAIAIVSDDRVVEVRSRAGALSESEILQWDREIVQHLTPVLQGTARLNTTEGVALFGIDPLALSEAGGAPQIETAGGDLILSRRLASDSGLALGDTVSLVVGDVQTSVIVGGILSDSVALKSSLPFAVLHIGFMQHLLKREGEVDALWIPSLNEELEASIRAYFAHEHPALVVTSKQERRDDGARLLGAFQTNIGILVLISLGVCVLTIYNSSRLSMTLVREEIAILRTLGASSFFCVAVFLFEPILLGTLGAALGVTVGAPGIHLVSAILLDTVNTLYRGNSQIVFGGDPALPILWPMALGISIAVLGSLSPILAVSRVRPFLVRPRRAENYHQFRSLSLLLAFLFASASMVIGFVSLILEDLRLAYGACLSLVLLLCVLGPLSLKVIATACKGFVVRVWRVAGLVAAGNLTLSSGSHGVSSATSAIGIAVLVSLGVMITSFRETLTDWIDRTIVADLYVRSEVGIPSSIADSVEAVRGVAALYRYIATSERDDKGPYLLAGVSLDVGEERGNIVLLRGSFPRGEAEVLVSEAFARKRKCDIGSRIVVLGREVIVVGIVQDFSAEQGIVYLGRRAAQSLTGKTDLTSLTIFLGADVPVHEVRGEIERTLRSPELTLQDNQSLRQLILSIFEDTFRITGVLRGIVAIICAGSLVLAFRQLLWERRGLLRTLYVLGAGVQTTRRALLIEAAVLALNASVLGVAFGLGLAMILVYIINPLGFGWTLTFSLDAGDIAYPILFIVTSCIVGATFSSGSVPRLPTAREESAE